MTGIMICTQIKTPNYMQQSIVKFIALSYRHCAVSVRQSNRILQLIVASSWVFYLSD